MSDQQPHSVRPRATQPDPPHPWRGADALTAEPPATYNIGQQQAAEIYQAGRDQYNTYQQHYELRIAPMLDRARRLLRLGAALMLAATAIYIWVFLRFGGEIVDWNQALFNTAGTTQDPDLPDISFAPLAMLPIAFIMGFAGFVMAVVALMTRRRARQEERQL